MDIVLITAVIASLFLVIAAAEPLAARLRLPYSVILAVLGMMIGVAALFFLRTELTDALNPVAEAILGLPIRSNVFLYVFLPTLLFQATLGMNLRRMLDDWVPILVLAVVAVVVATLSVGYALAWVSPLPLVACLLIGAIVSTTDPSAVVSIFRSISAPRRLARIIEGESLLNDAAAIALFGLFMGFVMRGVPDPEIGPALARFPILIGGGAAAGWLAARVGLWVMALFGRHELAVISVSVALPYLAYIGAEQSIGASGVIAVVAAGLTLNLAGPGRLPPQAWLNLREVWDLLAHWAGALIFILAALLIPRLLEGTRPGDFLLIGVVILAAIAARAVILFGLLPLLTLLRASPVVERPYRTAILWGGLRGAVTLALALAVTESFRVPVEVKRLVGILATGFTLFTLLVQGTTLRMVIGWLGLDRLSSIDEAISRQVVAVALQTVREDVARTTEAYALSRDIVRSEAKAFGERLELAVKAAEDTTDILERDRITLGLIALAGFERETILDRVRERTISGAMAEPILSDADRLIEATRVGGRNGYQRAARRSVAYGGAFRLAVLLHNRLRLSAPLVRMTSDRFERLLSQRLILRDLGAFVDTRIRRIHGPRVADLLHELLARRIDIVETALEGLRLQYPGHAEELERRFIRRTALRMEEREYTAMREDGLIGAEVYTALMQDLAGRRALAEARPRLDLAVQRAVLVRQFPFFADLDEAALRRLSRSLRTRYVDAGRVIVRKDTPLRSVYFIASGAVELERAGQTWRLGRGEMFGQMAILSDRTRRTEVRTIAPSTLLVLDETRFRSLLKRSAPLRNAVRASAEKRGIELSSLEEMEL
ncbi:putative Na+/H+ antiporter with cyclic nucleotide-binding domain [Oceanicola granulosus HTCC2516]|uniref:Putative Na+/H+ antiporter with cyclic nucleotide-binding domain n=1 Tax=Oceanicola granulosus (strain ATCC BAA-861 / DSM 15982 / KCTC 12143 / HTCC2516) TaxID=314256 RepID=Q2CI11_OCEGH|nr:cation:proton antiporter [Oceanicola granulosus]EAR52447.1 putative Na+/H+ antiporter with cyclic nucleotide-binding domain [Oceanicola granulosus HTCC2516]